MPAVLYTAADLIRQGELQAATDLLNELMDNQQEDFIGTSNAGRALSGLFVPACVYAQLLDRYDTAQSADATLDNSWIGTDVTIDIDADDGDGADSNGAQQQTSNTSTTSSSSKRPPSTSNKTTSSLRQLVRYQLDERARKAAKDTVVPVAHSLSRVLGAKHPVVLDMMVLADRNMSVAARQAAELRKQQEQLAIAANLLKVKCCCWSVYACVRPTDSLNNANSCLLFSMAANITTLVCHRLASIRHGLFELWVSADEDMQPCKAY